MNRPTWSDLAAAYVLGALDADERAEFEARLATDPELREEVRAQRELLGVLADAAPPRTAPGHLKARIMDRARATAPITSASSGGAESTRSGASRTEPIGSDTAGPDRTRMLPWMLAAAAAVAALTFGISSQRLSDRAAELQAQVEATEAAMERTAAELAERDSLLNAFLGPDVRTATLAATDAQPSARLFWNASTGNVVVTAFGLPPAPEGRIYQLWGIGEGRDPVSLGTFQTGPDGTAIVQAEAPADAQFDLSAVTEEPAGGSPQPTSTPFLVGSWAQD